MGKFILRLKSRAFFARHSIKKAIEDFKQNCDNAIKSINKMNIFDDTDMLENVEYVIQELN